MNIMRKLWVSGTGPGSFGGSGGGGGGGNGGFSGSFSGSNSSQGGISLGLMHLRKMFGEYLHTPSDDKIYNMLPLFCKVFGSSSASDMVERFPEINSFCQVVSKLMVSEVRKRAANQSTEAAAVSIIRFFETSSESEEDSQGWNLLSTLNLLSVGEQNLVDVMTAATVPSTLVKCLYLFFDLPEIQPPETKGPASDFSPMERRLLLQKVFVQLLIRLSSHPAPAEELAKRDDLALLFSAVTSWCPPQNAMWRKSASEVLMTISTHGLTPPVLSYIHNKSCVSLCVENLRRGLQLTPLEVTEMVLTLFCFLKDSSDLSQILLDDFKSSQGYQFFIEVLLRLEADSSSESQEAIRNLVLVISSLTMCGFTILKPNMANVESLFSLPTFQLPPNGAKGCTVRNLQAFQVLPSVFSKSTTAFLSGVILESILSIFKADHSNYFIVDSVLPQMAEKLIIKATEVQQKFFEIVEFIVFQLQFTPCKELIAVSRILKNDLSECSTMVLDAGHYDNNGASTSGSNRNSLVFGNGTITLIDIGNEARLKLLCVKMLLNLAKHNALFKDVFREIGILEVIITSLHRFESDTQNPAHLTDANAALKEELGLVVIELLTLVVLGTTQNVNIFRENNGSKCTLQLIINSSRMRGPALGLMQQLLMSQGGEEDMASVLVALHSANADSDLGLKIEILTGLLSCFRESHRARTNFRKAGGFLYLMSVLVSMEGLLLQRDISNQVLRERMNLVQLIFTAFALSMRFEPANAKLFHQEICVPSLADTLRLLGCFSREYQNLPSQFPTVISNPDSNSSSIVSEENLQLFHSIFTSSPNNLDPPSHQGKVPFSLILCVFLFRLLYDLAIDAFERNFSSSASVLSSNSFRSSPRKQASGEDSSANPSEPGSGIPGTPTGGSTASKKLSVGSLNLTPPCPEPVVIHAGVVLVMVKLIPSIWGDACEDSNESDKPFLTCACQLYCAELVKSLVRNERNQQAMAQVGLTEEILERCSVALSDENHYLHSPLHYAFERVATHYLSPKDFRRFLRLGNPLNCERSSPPSANISTVSIPVPVSRVQSLVSMTLPKSASNHNSQTQTALFSNIASPSPAFVEFDMSAEGFGALFLPSLAPHNVPIGNEFGSSSILATGIGMTGMSFSTWFSVDKFSERNDPHPIRILTIIKENGASQRLCLCIVVSARDKAMLVSTRESSLPPQGIGEWEPDGTAAGCVRVWCPELLHEGQWHHLFFSFSTSSSHAFTLYVNGRQAYNGKLDYPHKTKGASYSAFIGTPPLWRKTSRLTWRQGVAHFFEDWVPSAQTVHSLWKLGPDYPGSWQAVKIQSETSGTLIAEDKIIFGLNAMAVSQLTLAKIRKIYSKTDAKSIAKQLGLSSHENATPISILHNSAAHLIGPARTLGGVTIGYLGVRIFTPLPVAKSVLSVGGIQVLIGLVAMATTGEALYASLKAVVCVVKSNVVSGGANTTLVDNTIWQMLAYLLKRKKHLLSMRVLHLVIGLVSSDPGVCSAHRENRTGFIELLGDIDIWCPLSLVGSAPSSSKDKSSTSGGPFDSGASTPSSDVLKKQVSSEEPTPGSAITQTTTGHSLLALQKFDFLQANVDLEKALYEHFLQILNDDPKNSLDILREANIVPKLLRRLTLAQSSLIQGPVFLLLTHLLAHKGNASAIDLITFGHFIVGSLPLLDTREHALTDTIELRNKGLQLIHSLMYTGKVLNVGFCEELVSRLGYDFVLLFATANLHPSTVLWALRILLLLITSSAGLKAKFREGTSSAWCFGKTALAAQQSGGVRNPNAFPLKRQDTRDADDGNGPGASVLVGSASVTNAISSGLTGKTGKGIIGGWVRLSWLLAQRCEEIRTEGSEVFPVEIWLILCAMVLSQPCRNVSLKTGDPDQLTLDSIWNYVFAVPSNRMTSSLYGKVTLCQDAIITLLTLIRCFITAESVINQGQTSPGISGTTLLNPRANLGVQSPHNQPSSPCYHSDIGSCLVQFLCYLYSHTPEFQTAFTSIEILSALAAAVMPIEVTAGSAPADLVDISDCEEVKAFADSEPMVLVGKKSTSESEDTSTVLNHKHGEESPTANKVGEVAPVYPSNQAGPVVDNLMNHSAKKIILDFLRMLIIDWMSASGSQSQSKTGVGMNVVIDTVLEAGSTEAELLAVGNNLPTAISGQYSAALMTQFHTNLLGTLLDHLIAFDLDRMTAYLQAVAHFLSRLVDKLWLETFVRDPHVIFDFILILVNHCRTKRVPPTTTDMIYNSLNRVVLFVLSRKSNQWDKVEALKKLRSVRTIIFGSGNHQQEFFGCLVHVLMQLVDGIPISLESGNRTQWHVRVSSASTDGESDSSSSSSSLAKSKSAREAAKLDTEVSKSAEIVWGDLFISKKPMVEDLFKITFPSTKPPTLSSLRDEIGDASNKLWLAYLASETNPGTKKSGNPAGLSQSWEIHQQLQSKLQKVTGGLTRLAGRSGIRKDSEKEKTPKDVVSQWPEARKCQNVAQKHVKTIKDVLEAQERFHIENVRHLHRYVRDTLLPQLEFELTRERGLWGPSQPSHLDKWMLDTTEGPSRMRKKLMRNDMFYMHYPYSEPELISSGTGSAVSSPKPRRINPPISRDSKEFHKRFKHQPSLISDMCNSLDDIDDSGAGGSGSTSSEPNLSPRITVPVVQTSVDDSFSEGIVDTSADPDNQSMLFRLLGTSNEKISQIFRVAQIQGLDTAEGLLLYGKDHFYLISGFTILAKTREIKDMYYLPANMYEPILPPQCYGSGPSPAKPRSKIHTCWKFAYEDLREVHKRRYLLQPIALEIFCSDGINYLLAFPRKVRNVVFQKFTSVSKNLSDSGIDAKQSVAGQRRTASVEQSAGLFSSLIGDTSVTQRWVRGEISNFQYLMYMNTLAGRSYNDLMQYPVFPWIIADYDSPYLDFNDPSTFRDLSKPMGAQSNGRLVQFVKRFKEWDDPHGETPPYHYGTHYSSAMIVCSYLVRMEPFAQHFLRLQGGHFDLADRMFHSIREAWTSASKHNMADVKELIPEFFYLPEFLKNSNNFDLGSKQNGVALGDVLLPPWAKDDPVEFIRVHREALESDYVSQHLHEWIDLIFGYRQQGPPAVEAVNVFHHLFYEGNVDIYTIDDPLKKNATIGFINNFGQIPKQLFKKPHPVKRVNSSGGSLSSGLGLGIMKPSTFLESQLSALTATASSSISSQGSTSSGEKLFFHHVDHLRPTMTPIKELKGPIGQIMPLDRANSIIAVEQNKFLMSASRYISWGFADCSVRVCHVDTDRPLFIWEQCQQEVWMGSLGEIVTCTAASEKLAITGSTNTVVSVWDVVDKELRLKAHLYGHSEPITCLTCSPSYNIIVSGSKDLTCIIWDLARLSFVRQLVSHTAPIDAVGVNELTGDIASCDGSWLRLWSINGDPIGQIDTAGVGGGGGMSQGILCVSFSYLNEWDPDNVIITGSTDGIVRMWSIRYVQVPKEDIRGNPEGSDAVVNQISLTDDSSIATASDSEEHGEPEPILEAEDDLDGPEPDADLLGVDVFDPDKDRDSMEDVRDETRVSVSQVDKVKVEELIDISGGKETQVDKVKAIMRRQRALSSGTSSSRQDSDSAVASPDKKNPAARTDSLLTIETKKANRKSDIPKQVSNSSTKTEGDSVDPESGRISIRCSKSENSLSFETEDSFDVLSENEIAALRKEEQERKLSHGSALLAAHKLREDHVWQKRLAFRGKLTMHTAYDRKDNTEPASITAITVSRDNKNVYVGDARGRVFSWAVSDSAAGRVDHWVRDDVSDACGTCKTKFTMTERRHHCRSCGAVFCSKCSRFESEIFRLRILRPVRVCQPCFVQLKGNVKNPKSSTSSET